VLQQRKLHVLEKEMRQPKQQLEKLVQVVEDDVPQPLKAEQNVEPQQDVDELLVQQNVEAQQNVDDLQVQNVEQQNVEVPAEQNENVLHQDVDVDKHQKPLSYFFLIKPLVKYY
jgi:hypothetical protein